MPIRRVCRLRLLCIIGRNCPVQTDGTRKSLGCNSRSINSLWSSCITLIFEIGDIAITGSQGYHSN